jgi:hypothetical protein
MLCISLIHASMYVKNIQGVCLYAVMLNKHHTTFKNQQIKGFHGDHIELEKIIVSYVLMNSCRQVCAMKIHDLQHIDITFAVKSTTRSDFKHQH